MKKTVLTKIVLTGIFAGSCLLTLWSTGLWGIGLQTDGIIYLDIADFILQGKCFYFIDGFSGNIKPLSHFPPGYPLVIAMVSKVFSLTPFAATRWINAICMLILLFLIWRLAGGRNSRFSIWACALIGFSPHVTNAFCYAQSEPLFLVVLFGGLALLSGTATKRSWVSLILAGLLIGISFTVRYVGLAAMVAGGLYLLLAERDWRKKVFAAFLFSLSCLIPSGAWMGWRFLQAGTVSYDSAPPELGMRLAEAFRTFGFWLLPGVVPESIRAASVLITFVLLFAALIWLMSRHPSVGRAIKELSNVSRQLLLFCCVYIALLICTTLSVGTPWPFGERILLPFQCAFFVLLARMSDCLRMNLKRPVLRILILLAWAGLAGTYIIRDTIRTLERREFGLGYIAKQYREMPWATMADLVPDGAVVYTDEPSAVFWCSRIPCRPLPFTFLRDDQINPGFPSQFEEFEKKMAGGEAFCLLLSEMSPVVEKVLARNSVLKVQKNQGMIWIYSSKEEREAVPD